MAKISVIVPIYNVEVYLKQCLESLVNQTMKDIEIICVKDASPDNCNKILEIYKNQYNNIKVINHTRNRGVASARNIGLEHSSCE